MSDPKIQNETEETETSASIAVPDTAASKRRAGPETGAKIMILLSEKAMSADALASRLAMDPSYIRSVLKMLVEAGVLRTWVVPQHRKKSVRLFSWADALSESEQPSRRK